MMQRKVDYRSGSDNLTTNDLEVPPDLTAPSANNSTYALPTKSLATYQAASSVAASTSPVLQSATAARVVQDGNQRWLEVKGAPEKVWPQLREFWLDNGFLLKIDNPSIGIMETDWLENRANLPQDWFTRVLRKVADSFISTGELDKFRTRIERGSAPDTTDIYLTHRGMVEVFADGSSDAKVSAQSGETKTIWTPRPSDPELEAEMLALMLQRFGMTGDQAAATVQKPAMQQARAALVDNSQALAVYDSFDRAWRRVGLALDMSGYVVTDRDRSKGVYYVRRADADIAQEKDSDFWGKMKFWGSKDDKSAPAPKQNEFEIKLAESVNQTKLVVSGRDGKPADANAQQALLSALLSQLK
ncbi:outer membrane protein assembly factor BamC [Andreprevotia sp. IGB-42]|uniref:outer membrane protein assembly factor BamC n=1 Tax=Andreprevotia sp. IGB-42 TaxID=2497473 RepID=UPI00135BA4C3|nr:outer membrane protein assembly factor BamC [Andreprevotia sp. IGB-42]